MLLHIIPGYTGRQLLVNHVYSLCHSFLYQPNSVQFVITMSVFLLLEIPERKTKLPKQSAHDWLAHCDFDLMNFNTYIIIVNHRETKLFHTNQHTQHI